jgi:putative NADH-flavin reductase
MLLTIFGASGRTGAHLVSQALESGFVVRAFSRKPEKISLRDPGLTISSGDIVRIDQVKEAVQGVDAVLSVLSPTTGSPDLIVSRGTENIILAMEEAGVRRLIVTSGAGVPEAGDNPTLVHKTFAWFVRTFSSNVFNDMVLTVELVQGSDLDWTIVRVPRLTDGPRTGDLRVGYLGQGIGTKLTRADLAAFLLEQINHDHYIHEAPVVSNS